MARLTRAVYTTLMKTEERARDRRVMREIHRLFWRANLADKPTLVFCYLTRIPAMALYNVLIPVQIAYGIQAIVLGHFNLVSGYAWRVFFLSVGYTLLWIAGGLAIARNAIVGSEYLQKQIFTNFLNKDYDFYSNTYFGSLSAQANRIRDAFNEYGAMVTLGVPKQLTIIVAGIVIIGYHSTLLAVITILTVASILAFTLWSSAWRLKYRRLMSEASSDLAGVMGDALSHGSTVKSFAAEGIEADRLTTTLKTWSRAQYASWNSSLPADGGRMILAAIATAILLVFTARLYEHHTISIAIVALAQLYVVKMVSVTQDIAEIIKSYEAIMSGAYQPVKTMLIEQTIKDKPNPIAFPKTNQLHVAFDAVNFGYSDAKQDTLALTNYSLRISPGEKVGMVGYSGSGKTTLTKLMLRFMDVTSGSITVNDIDLRDMRQADIRNAIAYVPQEPLLFNRSIEENIGYGNVSATKRKIREAAKLAYVDELLTNCRSGIKQSLGNEALNSAVVNDSVSPSPGPS